MSKFEIAKNIIIDNRFTKERLSKKIIPRIESLSDPKLNKLFKEFHAKCVEIEVYLQSRFEVEKYRAK